jgi:hypothetical protein
MEVFSRMYWSSESSWARDINRRSIPQGLAGLQRIFDALLGLSLSTQ